MEVDPEDRRARNRFGSFAGIAVMLATLGIACACALYVHANGIASGTGFLALTLATTVAQAMFTWQIDARFGRPTNGTSGAIGMAMIWFIVRAVAGIAIVVCGLAGVCGYVAAYLAAVIICGIIDTALVITGL